MTTPNPIITKFPTVNVASCSFAERCLCAIPLIDAKKLCQENEAMKAPEMKRIAFTEDEEKPCIPRIRAVKYVTVTGFRSVNPRTIP